MIVDLVNVMTRDGVRLDGVLQSPGAESKPVWTIPEFVPLAPSASSGSASSSTTRTSDRESASAVADPTTPPPTTATSRSVTGLHPLTQDVWRAYRHGGP